jgi:pimeloyl-ACP methyl ester carboxylesterase
MAASQTARTIVLLHGWTLSPSVTEKWQPFIRLLKQAGYTVKFWPLPGLAEAPAEPLTLQDYADWLEEKTRSLKSFLLLGHSFGGQLAIRFARLHPEKVDRLILVDSSGMLDTSLAKTLKRGIFKTLAKTGKMLTQSPSLRRWLYRLTRETDYYEASPSQRQTMQNLLKDQITDDLSQLSMPTLIIWGAQDRATPPKFGKLLAAKIPQAELHYIPEARHSPQYTHPEQTLSLLMQFLKDR